MALTNYIAFLYGSQTRYWAYPTGFSCSEGEAAFAALSPAERYSLSEAVEFVPASDEKKQLRNCGSAPPPPSGDVITDVESQDPNDTAGNPPPGSIGVSRIDPPSEPDRMDCYLEWTTVDGQPEAILKNRVLQPAITAGGQRMWWINGSKDAVVGSWQDKSYPPDTSLNIYYGEGPQEEIYPQGYVHKAYQYVYVGQPNT